MTGPLPGRVWSLVLRTGAFIRPSGRCWRQAPCAGEHYNLLVEVSEYLVGSAAFKAVGCGDPAAAGSIPVHLRHAVVSAHHQPILVRIRLFGFWRGPAPHRTTIEPSTRQFGLPA